MGVGIPKLGRRMMKKFTIPEVPERRIGTEGGLVGTEDDEEIPGGVHCLGRKPWDGRRNGEPRSFLLQLPGDLKGYISAVQPLSTKLSLRGECLQQ